jgi:DNA invertase Pin-like site-specific DNA recombinase
MTRVAKPAPAADPARKQAVIYARVSSKEQEKEGFSIPAQLKLLKEYAAAHGLAVAQEYIDVETAKQTGRAAFGEMVAYLKARPSVRVMLVEKTDRLYRNLKDWVTVDELDVEMHFPKEGVVLSRESRSSEKFMHGIKVLMAKNYIDNLSEEARKGMQEKAEQGIWPTKTPLGYRNIIGPDGKKIIANDPSQSPIVAQLFEWYARGDISLKEAARKANAAGLLYPKSGAKLPVSTIHTILRTASIRAGSNGTASSFRASMRRWCRSSCGSAFRACSTVASPAKPSAAGMTSPSQASSPAMPAAAPWSARSRSSATSIIIAPATPISARGTQHPAVASMCGRKRSKRGSPNCSGGFDSTTRSWNGCTMRCTPATPTSAARTRKRSSGIRPNTSG